MLVAGLLAAGLAHPAPRMLAVSLGDCVDPELRAVARALDDKLRARLGADGAGSAELARGLRPEAGKTPDELRRQQEAAETQFYSARNAAAARQLTEALADIEQLAPGEERRGLAIEARLLQAQVLRAMGRFTEADESFRHVLRLAPRYRLDVNYFSPSTRAAFEKVRKGLEAMRPSPLQVTSTPTGADVFLDGVHVGKTPLEGRFRPGPYQLQVTKGASVSFPRPLQLLEGVEAKAQVDLAFEGSVIAGEPLCLQAREGGVDPLRSAVKLGALLGVEEIVVLRLQRQANGPGWVTASLLNAQGGQRVREGSLKTSARTETDAALGDLVAFIVTGQSAPTVVQGPAQLTPAPAPAPAAPQAAAAAPAARPAPEDAAGAARRRRYLRVGSYVAGGVALAAFGTAGLLYERSAAEREVLARRAPGGVLRADDAPGAQLYRDLRSQGRTLTGLLVGGGASAAAGAALYFFSREPEGRLQVAGAPSLDGTGMGVQVHGRF
ncbi:MAG TPA: PEGA domain-containing protein [Aggregicoccus sp.]|nr:PEGA domain-containing protein [Aggregicoccus sp.]